MFKSVAVCAKNKKRKKFANSRRKGNSKSKNENKNKNKNEAIIEEVRREEHEKNFFDFLLKPELQQQQQEQQQELYQFQLSPRYFQYLRSNCAALPLLITTTTTTKTHAANRALTHTPTATATASDGSGRRGIHAEQNGSGNDCIRDREQVEEPEALRSEIENNTKTIASATATATVTATSATSLSCKAMPLSQGHYAKCAFAATKRAAIKASRIGDEPKQRKYDSENNNHNNNNNNNNNNHNNNNNNGIECIGDGGFQKSNTANCHIFLGSPKASKAAMATPPSRLQWLNTNTKSNTNSHFTPHNNNTNTNNNNNTNNGSKKNEGSLQFSYYIGESLARCGHLQEAFDIYALIASKQLDGSVPLDRLNVLATCLIEYVRQLQKRQLPNADGGASSKSAAIRRKASFCDDDDIDCGDVASKRKYAKCDAQATTRPVAVAVSTAPSIAVAIDVDPTDVAVAVAVDVDDDSTLVASMASDFDDHDPLLCPLCNDILRCPVTANCGHTFCRQCCEVITACNVCHMKFPRVGFDGEFAASLASPATTTTTTTAAAAAAAATGMPSLFAFPMTFNGQNPSLENFPSLRQLQNISNAPTPTSTPPTLTNASRDSQRAVTTSTVSLTTATATTTMASTPTAGGGVGSAGGVAASLRFMTDVTVRRLVEKWWGPDLQAQKISETAASYMHLNLLDDALKFCNASLEKSPTNFKSLLLRAEVLRKLNHFQSSLADVDNALRSRYTSAKGHYLRALVLTELGRIDEALYDTCLAISLDKATNLSSSEIFQHDLAKVLQKLLAQAPKTKSVVSASGIVPHRNHLGAWPCRMLAEQRFRRKQNTLTLCTANGENLDSLGRDLGLGSIGKPILVDDADLMAGDDDFLIAAAEDDDDDDDDVDDDDVAVVVDDDGYEVSTRGAAAAAAAAAVAAYAELAHADCGLMTLRRPSSRKHFRRKWVTKETQLVPNARCCTLFRDVLERTQHELQRLKKLEASGADQHKQQLQVPQTLIDASDFDCVLCCRTFWKPVVTPCGHTYCWVCLDRCMDYTSSCPLCMSPLVESNVNMYQGSSSPVPFVLAKRPVTKFLEAAMKRFIPESYEKRFRQEMDMEPSVPVFICTTAFPCVPCPLFVYEPRYRLMVRRAVESGEKQFGIVQPHSGKSRYFDVGTILDIRDCVLLGDGCSILSTIGCKRFRILARNEKDGYETAKVEYIYDETIADENIAFVSNMHAAVLTKAVDWFESLSVDLKQEILQSFGEMPPVEDNWEQIADGPAWAWWIIALLPLKQQLKVGILATTSLEKRLRAIEKTLDYLSGSFQRSQQSCDVVVVQQQQQQQLQQQQQQEQHDQQQQCAVDLTHSTSTSSVSAIVHDECCQRTTEPNVAASMHSVAAAATTTATNSTGEQHAQLLL